jgi:hypothetical protein
MKHSPDEHDGHPTARESETPETDAHLSHLNLPDGNKVGIPIETVALLKKLERRLSLAETMNKGHRRIEDELKEENTKLRVMVTKLRVMVDECHDWLEDTRRKSVEAQARIAELEKDAARYRWLREGSLAYKDWKVSRTILNYGRPERQWLHGDSLDAAIDAALKSRA